MFIDRYGVKYVADCSNGHGKYSRTRRISIHMRQATLGIRKNSSLGPYTLSTCAIMGHNRYVIDKQPG